MKERYVVVDAMYNYICTEYYEGIALQIATEIGGDVIELED